MKENPGIIFKSGLDIDEMFARLNKELPLIDWKIGNKYYEGGFYIYASRVDGVKIKINKEDKPGEYYLGVFVVNMPVFPGPEEQNAIIGQVQKEILPVVEART